MTAEQIVDSAFAISGKALNSEPLTLDVDGRRPVSAFLNLGIPTRAWQFTSLSNERDRPALAMPNAQSIVDVLEHFGWRSSRQNAVTVRDTEPTVQQPAILANGILARRVSGLSDDSHFTQLCIAAETPHELVNELIRAILCREARDDELSMFVDYLRTGFENRITSSQSSPVPPKKPKHAVSWSNHLSADATIIKLEMERLARAGDPPTSRLGEDWRSRAEDVVWALVNSPEFIFVP